MWKCPICKKENIGAYCCICGRQKPVDAELPKEMLSPEEQRLQSEINQLQTKLEVAKRENNSVLIRYFSDIIYYKEKIFRQMRIDSQRTK